MKVKFFLAGILLCIIGSMNIDLYAQTCTGTGSINYQKWNNISGTSISNLTSNSNYPNSPSSSGTRTSFEMNSNAGSNFGIKMYGYLCPPTTGNYVFWIASDDSGELWLSTSSNPAARQRIAYHTGYTNSRQWTKYSTQKSATVSLVAGQVYYIDALMKEGSGSDNLAVGWSKPGQSTNSPSQVIPGSNLMTQYNPAPDTQAPTAPTNLVVSNLTETSLDLSWNASSDNVSVSGYDVFKNGIKINSTQVTSTSYPVNGLTSGTNYAFYIKANDAAGNSSGNSNTVNPTTLVPVTCPGTGTITYQQWNNIAGTTIANLTSSANFPNNPSSAGTLSKFETVTNTADNYGIKVCGYLCPPLTGSYTFWIASDDNGELWLSTTSSASNKIRIAYHTAWTNSQEWSKYSTQKSVAINMIAGQQYYIEALMKEGGGGDNLAVGWAKPGQSTSSPSEVIPGDRLLPLVTVIPDVLPPTSPTNLAVSNLTQSSLTLSWTGSTDNVGVAGYDVYQNGSKINGATIVGTSYNVNGLSAASNYAYYVLAKDAAGNTASSNTLNVTTPDTQAPTAPTNLTVSNLTQTSLTLSWTASTDNVGVVGYDVYQNGVKVNTSTISGTSQNISGLTVSTSYGLYVIAKDAAGNTSTSSTLNVVTPDTQAPSAPTNLAVTNLTQSSLTLSWTASTDNVGVAGYDVYQNGSKINGATIAGTNFNVSGLSAAINYAYYVKAKDAAGNSTNSTTLNVTTPDTQAPTAPTNLAATNLTQTSFMLSWTASTDNVGVIGYDVYQDGIKINGGSVVSTSYNISGLSLNTPYTYLVRAIDAATNMSAASSSLLVTTLAAPDTEAPTAPTNLAVTNLTQSSLTLSWTASTDNVGVAGYDVYQNGSKINGATIVGTSYNFSGLSATTNYAYYVKAKDAAGNSTNSSTLNVTTPDTQAPSAPTNLAYSSLTQASLTLTWTISTDNVGVTGYDVYRDGVKINGSNVMGSSYPVTGLSASTLYTFYVTSKDAAGNSTNSSNLNVTTPDTQAPSAPTNLAAANLTQSSLTLSWSASTDNVGVTGYDVYRNGVKINGSNIAVTSFNVTGLSASTSYAFYVVAKDAASNSTNSSTLNVTTPDTQSPTAPTNLASSAVTQTTLTLSWTASTDNVSVIGYDMYRNGIKINGSNITATSYIVTGLTAATSYSFYVIAKDAAGNTSLASTTLHVTTTTVALGTETFTQRTVIASQNMPHDLVYGPDNNLWYIERFAGTVSFVNIASGAKTTLLTLGSAMVLVGGQDGLFGLALHPQLLSGKPYVYIAYTYQSSSSTVRKTRIARYTYNSGNNTLGSAVTVLENIPGSNDHNAGRLAIGPDLKLYYSIGDMGAGQFDNTNRTQNAQNVNVYEGKILRLNTEQISGSWIPADNPFGNTNAVYSLGHRNPQGLVWGNVNGTDILYSDEHGPYSDDEVNLIEGGRNYGWPQVAGLCDGNYNGRTLGTFNIVSEQTNCANLNVKEPLKSLFPVGNPPSGGDNMTWPSTAPSGADFYGSNAIPGWQNSLLIAQLKRGAMLRYKLSNDGQSIISDTIHYFQGKGRFRDVVVSPDGLKIYLACDASGSTSGPTGGVTTTPANPGSILEFTYSPTSGLASSHRLTEFNKKYSVKDNSTDIYPNPASDYIVVYNYNDASDRTVEIFNLYGQLMKRERSLSTATKIETGDMQNGFYLLKVSDSKGRLIRSERVLIQR